MVRSLKGPEPNDKKGMAVKCDRWWVYILECADGSFYTGITTEPKRRLEEHNGPDKGAKYTRSRQPVIMVYQKETANRSEASKLEYAIKKMDRKNKEALIKEGGATASSQE